MTRFTIGLAAMICVFAVSANAQLPGHEPNLGDRITQAEVTSGSMTLFDLRREGRRVFTTPFNKLDGFGVDYDPSNPDHTSFPNRPTLQNNGTFLRINGLDGQTCQECHGILDNSTVPVTLGLGGVGGISASPMFMPSAIDVADVANQGFADFNGRLINPPFIFGAGAVEAIGKEMTADLQALKMQAFMNPGSTVNLVTKGVSFGSISYDGTDFDFSDLEGVDHDLVIRPFGRKGENFTTRDFDRGAMQFHFGMEPNEVVGGDTVDQDGDGVVNEVTIGEMSVLHTFVQTQPNNRIVPQPNAGFGFALFASIGCVECHRPVMTSDSNDHSLSFPDVGDDPYANIYLTLDLRDPPMEFLDIPGAGIAAFFFADLKRHEMGPELAESFGHELDDQFTTARLWGANDTAPYIHDGRSFTLSEAILAHGGEAQQARDNFDSLADYEKIAILSMLRSLRVPIDPSMDLGPFDEGVNN